MKPPLTRICIYPKDIQRITGRSERYCRELMYAMRRAFNKEDHQFISIDEFCKFTGLNPDDVRPFITD